MKAWHAALVLLAALVTANVQLYNSHGRERTAYARGYAAAVDSVRAFRSMHDDIGDILRAHGIRYSVVLALQSETDSTTAVIHAGTPR